MGTSFAADRMLGKLAKRLRLLGVDTVYCNDWSPGDLLDVAASEDRTVLTRNTHLPNRASKLTRSPHCILIEDDHPFYQTIQVLRQIGMTSDDLRRFPQGALTRCIDCNTQLDTIEKREVRGRVWPHVYASQDHFAYCSRCDKILWKATHITGMCRQVDALAAAL